MSREELYLRELASTIEKGDERLGEKLYELCSFYTRRLWHQLTVLLLDLVSSEPALAGERLLELYSRFIVHCGPRLSQLKYVEIALTVCERSEQGGASQIEFLRELLSLDGVRRDSQASLLARAALGSALLKFAEQAAQIRAAETEAKLIAAQAQEDAEEEAEQEGKNGANAASSSSSSSASLTSHDETKTSDVLPSVKELIDQLKEAHGALGSGAESVVHARFYKLLADYHFVNGPAHLFFDNAMLYLANRPLELIERDEQRALAFDLCMAALVGTTIYNFGQLLSHAVVDSLQDTERAWIVELLRAFNRGDIAQYDAVVAAHEAELAQLPTLVRNKDLMKRKIQTLALMELVFKRPRDERVLSFQDISDVTKVPVGQVELLVIKALSLKLIRGTIDQVDHLVTITWVQPRVLQLEQIEGMRVRLNEWSTVVEQTLITLEHQSAELIQN